MEAMVVYRFHIALRDVSPKIWRRVELTAGNSVADLQRAIQISLGWSDEYQHRFCIRNHYLGASRPGGLLFSPARANVSRSSQCHQCDSREAESRKTGSVIAQRLPPEWSCIP